MVTCMKFVFSMKPLRASVKLVACVSQLSKCLFLAIWKGLTNKPGEADIIITECGINGIRASNIKWQLLFEHTFAIFSSHYPLYTFVFGGQKLSQCSRNWGDSRLITQVQGFPVEGFL